MSNHWPTFTTWNRIREEDRSSISNILSSLLANGALFGDSGRDRELYLLGREYQAEITEYLTPLHLRLIADPDHPIFQICPVPGECELMAQFTKAETLLVLTLWRIYHDIKMEQSIETVIITANEVWQRLKLYFQAIELPTAAQLREMLSKLRQRRLVRIQWHEESSLFGHSQIEILPTLVRVIPFENAAAWDQKVLALQSTAVEFMLEKKDPQ